MKYSLRSLMIVVLVAPPLLAGIVWGTWLVAGSFCWGSKPHYQIEDTVSDLDLPKPSAPTPNSPKP